MFGMVDFKALFWFLINLFSRTYASYVIFVCIYIYTEFDQNDQSTEPEIQWVCLNRMNFYEFLHNGMFTGGI